MNIILIVIYMLIGFQVGGRMFYWAIKINKMFPENKNALNDFIIPLALAPLLWPIILIMSCLQRDIQKALWQWDK